MTSHNLARRLAEVALWAALKAPLPSQLDAAALALAEAMPDKCFECDGELTVVCLKCNPEIPPPPRSGDER